jgi:hypothetical protein
MRENLVPAREGARETAPPSLLGVQFLFGIAFRKDEI